jgi:hypothetical protein
MVRPADHDHLRVPVGATSSMASWSVWVIAPSARVVLGEDWVTAGLHPVEAPGSAANANRDRLIGREPVSAGHTLGTRSAVFARREHYGNGYGFRVWDEDRH